MSDTFEMSYLQIDRNVLEKNARTVVDYVDTKVIGVVKFDGYGMTIAEAARAWQRAGVTMFAVAQSKEALALRRAGFREDILLMAPVADGQTLTELAREGIILTVHDLQNARFYQQHRAEVPLRVHVKVDTGMGRFGVRWTDVAQLKQIYALEGLRFEGIFSHFGKSFEKEYALTKAQLERFLKAVDALEAAGIQVGMRHIANSCAALRFPQTRLDAVRIGSALVGGLLAPVPVSLSPAHQFKAQVVAVQDLKKGDTLGYASVCKAKKDMKAAVVAVGLENGLGMTGAPDPYPWLDFAVFMYHLLQRYLHPPRAIFGDSALPMVGRVGSQYTLFEATDTDIKPGDYVNVRIPLLQCIAPRKFL